jgi:hypothetical protein
MEQHGLPEAVQLERIPDVEVGPPAIIGRLEGIGIYGVRPRAVIHALCPLVLRIRGEVVGELVLQFSQHGVVIGSTIVSIHGHVGNQWVQGGSGYGGHGVQVVLPDVMAARRALVPQGSDQMERKLVLGVERVVIGILGGKDSIGAAEGKYGCVACGRKIARGAVGRDCMGIRSIAIQRRGTAGDAVADVGIDGGWTAAVEIVKVGDLWIIACVGRDGDLFLVEAQAEAAAHDKFSVRCVRAPVESNLGPEVSLLSHPEIAALPDRKSGE